MNELIEILQNLLYGRYVTVTMPGRVIILELLISAAIGMYIFFVYRIVTRRSVYIRSFHISLPIITVITSVVIMTLQCSLLVTFGALGALSIIRFRTAIKDPIDLVFVFWSIAEGIVCGADLLKLAICSTIVLTLLIVVLEFTPIVRSPLYLIINLDNPEHEADVRKAISENTKRYKIQSRNVTAYGMDMIVEVESKDESSLINTISKLDSVKSASLITHEGDMNF